MSPKKYKCLTIAEKKELIEKVEGGGKKSDVAKEFKIPLSTLSTIIKHKEKINATRSAGVRKRTTKGDFPRLEESLVIWLRQCRGQKVSISGNLLKEKAKEFASTLSIKNFAASEGWLTNFKKRNGVVFKKVCGESGSVNDAVCLDWQGKLKTLIENYEARDIFNTDETGLFFKCLPDKTLTFKDEKCHGGKHSKERLTVLLTANMDGSEKLKPLVIGKAMKPRCFKGVKSFPTVYHANKKAWMTTDLFNDWLLTVNVEMKRQKRKILLFLDNCTVHTSPPTLSNVKLHFFPANTTSKLQPLDQGIIHNFKTFYRKEIVKLILESLDNQLTANITVLTAILLIDKAWRAVTPLTILNCFKKSGFIKEAQENQPIITEDEEPAIALLLDITGVSFYDFVQVDEDVAVSGSLTDGEILSATDTNEKSNDEDEDDTSESLAEVSVKEAGASFDTLQSFCLQNDTDETAFQALFLIRKVIDQSQQCALKQTNITDFFRKTNN